MNSKLEHTRPTLLLDRAAAGLRMTAEEFDAIGPGQFEEDYRYELIDGVLIVNPIEREEHSHPNDHLGYLLRDYQLHHPQGCALDVTLPERHVFIGNNRRKADRVIWAGLGRRPDPRIDVPAIVVEFVSSGRRNWMRDYLQKRDEYLSIGVKEYWIVDHFQRTLTVYTPRSAGAAEHIVAETDSYATPLLPGFQLPLAQLLAASDYWE